jgi:hypothetical protein
MAYTIRGYAPFRFLSPLIPTPFPHCIFLGVPPEPLVIEFLEDAESVAAQMNRAMGMQGAVFEVEQIPDPEPIPEPRSPGLAPPDKSRPPTDCRRLSAPGTLAAWTAATLPQFSSGARGMRIKLKLPKAFVGLSVITVCAVVAILSPWIWEAREASRRAEESERGPKYEQFLHDSFRQMFGPAASDRGEK